jgi:hypothetical protein
MDWLKRKLDQHEVRRVLVTINDGRKRVSVSHARTNKNRMEIITNAVALHYRPTQQEKAVALSAWRVTDKMGRIARLCEDGLCDISDIDASGRKARRLFERISKIASMRLERKG